MLAKQQQLQREHIEDTAVCYCNMEPGLAFRLQTKIELRVGPVATSMVTWQARNGQARAAISSTRRILHVHGTKICLYIYIYIHTYTHICMPYQDFPALKC